MIAHLKPQIRDIGVANFGNSPAIARNLRLDVTNLGFNLPHPELIEVPYKNEASRTSPNSVFYFWDKPTEIKFPEFIQQACPLGKQDQSASCGCNSRGELGERVIASL